MPGGGPYIRGVKKKEPRGYFSIWGGYVNDSKGELFNVTREKIEQLVPILHTEYSPIFLRNFQGAYPDEKPIICSNFLVKFIPKCTHVVFWEYLCKGLRDLKFIMCAAQNQRAQ